MRQKYKMIDDLGDPSQRIDISAIREGENDQEFEETEDVIKINDESDEEMMQTSFSVPEPDQEDEATMSRYSQQGKEEIEIRLKEEDRIRIQNSLESVHEVCHLTFEQLRYLIKCKLKDILLKIHRQEVKSEFDMLYRNQVQGNLELLSRIRESMFTKRQTYYIHGCLNGLFLDKYMPAMENFGYVGKVLYPEALIHIVSNIKNVSYDKAKELMENFHAPLEPETNSAC